MKMYAIPNCNTVKKARDFLAENGISYDFVDFKKVTPTLDDLKRWSEAFGGLPVNKQGMTYKKHKELYESSSPKDQMKLVQENPSMIKRPVLENNNKVLCFGFDEEVYGKL